MIEQHRDLLERALLEAMKRFETETGTRVDVAVEFVGTGRVDLLQVAQKVR